MYRPTFSIRPFTSGDLEAVIAILRANGQLNMPSVDGPEPLQRVHQQSGEFFLVAEVGKQVVGLIRGVWDGSRALIHQLSIHSDYQRHGIGTALVRSIARRFREKGAPTISVTATEETQQFYKRMGFDAVDVIFMVAFDINKVIDEAKSSDEKKATTS